MKLTLSSIMVAYSHCIRKEFWFYQTLNFCNYFRNYQTNTWHVCTYLNAFIMMISNIVMKFNNFDIFFTFCEMFDPSLSAHACRLVSVMGVTPLVRRINVKKKVELFCNYGYFWFETRKKQAVSRIHYNKLRAIAL